MYKLELTEEEHEFLKSCMETILSTDWYASAEYMEMAEALQEKLLALPKLVLSPDGTRLCEGRAAEVRGNKKGEVSMFNLDDCWDAAVIDFCRTRYPLALEPILVRTSTKELNDIYSIVPPDEFEWCDLTAIYESGVVKRYTVKVEDYFCNFVHYQRFIWRDPNTKVSFMPKEEIRD